MIQLRFSNLGTCWEQYARNHYPDLFEVMDVAEIRQHHSLLIGDGGAITLVSDDPNWQGYHPVQPAQQESCATA